MEEHHEHAEHHEEREHPGRASVGTLRDSNPYIIPFSIVLAGVIIAVAILFTNGRSPSVANKPLAAQAGNAVAAAGDFKALENGPTLGNPDAPVTVVEFADFQCPFCGRFYSSTAKSIMSSYVKNGQVKFVYHDFAFLGQESNWASEAARCAGDQGKFWQYHDYLYEHQNGENDGAFGKDHLKSFARELGLNSNEFNSCLDSGKHAQEVVDDTEIGRKFGVNGTPTSFVNGKEISGAQPFTVFQTEIDNALKAK
ncbi:MAG: DsbA family protein [bacterium]|nr:DsbA family protein [bacterium]MDZ4285403.1 DsbA family protein [Candidatus Sungbacteria bacterium]